MDNFILEYHTLLAKEFVITSTHKFYKRPNDYRLHQLLPLACAMNDTYNFNVRTNLPI